MAATKLNARISELFRRATGLRKPGALVHRQSLLTTRLECCEELVGLRDGLGIKSRARLRRALEAIEAQAKEQLAAGRIVQADHQTLIDRITQIRDRLRKMVANRRKRFEQQRISHADQQKLLAEAKRPFDLIAQCSCQNIVVDLKSRGFAWRKKLVRGRVVWQLISPIAFEVVSRREFDGKQ